MNLKIYKEFLIVANYLVLLTCIIFLDLQAFSLLLSLIIEYLIALLTYVYIGMRLGKSFLEKFFYPTSHLIGGLGLGIFQGALIFLLIYMLDGKSGYEQNLNQLSWLAPAIALPLIIAQVLSLRGKAINKELNSEKMADLVTTAVLFPVVIGAGLLSYECFSNNVQVCLIVIATGRILIEIWMNRLRKPKQTSIKKRTLI